MSFVQTEMFCKFNIKIEVEISMKNVNYLISFCTNYLLT